MNIKYLSALHEKLNDTHRTVLLNLWDGTNETGLFREIPDVLARGTYKDALDAFSSVQQELPFLSQFLSIQDEPSRDFVSNLVSEVAASFPDPKIRIELLHQFWNESGVYEEKEQKKLHRGGICMHISQAYRGTNDQGARLWWGLLAFIDDLVCLGGEDRLNWASCQMLQYACGLSSALIDIIWCEFVEPKRNNGDLLFSESILALVLSDSRFIDIVRITMTAQSDFVVSKGYLGWLLKRIRSRVSSPEQHGTQGVDLEALACYLATLLPGWIARKNVIAQNNTNEHDVILRSIHNPIAIADSNEPAMLVECKDLWRWDKKTEQYLPRRVNVEQVGYFLYRMKLSHSKVGILFTTGGITGESKEPMVEEAARGLMIRAFHEDELIVAVISLEELDLIAKGTQTLRSLIEAEKEVRRFGKARN